MNCWNRHIVFGLLSSAIIFLSINFACAASESAGDEQYCRKGVVYSIAKNRIVIDDILFELDGLNNSKDGYHEKIDLAGVKVGDHVMYCMAENSDYLTALKRTGETETGEFFGNQGRIQEKTLERARKRDKPSQSGNTIHLENGVWKN